MNIPVTDFHQMSADYPRVAQAIEYLEKYANTQPELSEIARAVGLSEYHFQRVFSRWAGISPKRFLQFLTKESAKVRKFARHHLRRRIVKFGQAARSICHHRSCHTRTIQIRRRRSDYSLRAPRHPLRRDINWFDRTWHMPPQLCRQQRRRRHRHVGLWLAAGQND